MSFSSRLKQLREENNMTQSELAKALGVGRPTIAGYETKDKQPSYEILVKLSKIFNCSSDYLLGISDSQTAQDERISQAIGADEELLEFWKVLKEREDLKLMLKQTKDLPDNDIKTIFRIIKSFEEENQS